MKEQRRDFLKLTAAGASGLALSKLNRAYAAWPSTGTQELNPTIANMRVVACVDPAMVKKVPSNMTFDTQNAAIDDVRVQANLDAMAMALAQVDTAEAAWKAIFRSSKDWASTVVAIKVNAGEAQNTAHLAILRRLSNLFIGWGVKAQNFIVYDGHTVPGAPGIFTASFSTTDTSKVLGVVGGPSGSSSDLLGGWKDAKLVDGSTRRCAAKIADGTVDILINIASNKGHPMFGKVTLCMKNHYGTWEPDSTHTDLNNLIFKMNKSDPIIGGNPPRQQLCMVDSLFCNKVNITGTPELMPGYLVMGTFAPAVDYLTVRRIREEVSKLSHDSAVIDSYLTSFGYATTDAQWVVVPPASGRSDAGTSLGAGGAGGARDTDSAAGSSGRGLGGAGASPSAGGRAGGAAGGSPSHTGGAGIASGGSDAGGVGGPSTGSGSTSLGGGLGSGGHGAGTAAGGASGGSVSTPVGAGGMGTTAGTGGATTHPTSSAHGCATGGPTSRGGGAGLVGAVGALALAWLRGRLGRRKDPARPTEGDTESGEG